MSGTYAIFDTKPTKNSMSNLGDIRHRFPLPINEHTRYVSDLKEIQNRYDRVPTVPFISMVLSLCLYLSSAGIQFKVGGQGALQQLVGILKQSGF